jgi:hypothetical protein
MAYPRSLADFVFETLPEVLMATLQGVGGIGV